jgi:galacturan 1,4-alpha-galacturonidase
VSSPTLPSKELDPPMYSRPLLFLAGIGVACARELAPAATTCTLAASGGDDGPSFVNAINTCDTIVVPQTTTLNIASRMNTTGVANKHISILGTVKFAANLPYWTGVSLTVLTGSNVKLNIG